MGIKYYSAKRQAAQDLYREVVKRCDICNKLGPATDKQIEYVKDLQKMCEAKGYTDYPKDSRFDTNNKRATTLIKMLCKYIRERGINEEWL